MASGDNDGTTIVDDEDSTPSACDNGEAPEHNESATEVSARRQVPSPLATSASEEPTSETISLPPSDLELTGRTIENRYTLVERIGNGAHGNVWVAHDRIIDERVAFKWMRLAHDASPARVRREITMLRMLRFPGIVKFIDEGVADGRPFIVMELFPGRPFPGFDGIAEWQTIANTTLALFETLSHVHAAGIVHRDIKPDNVLVRSDGRPGILDFGISQLREPNLGTSGPKGIAGTPLYLAPEQILCRQVDARTDLYAVGLMLYQALAGILPHEAPDRDTIQRLRLTAPVRPLHEVARNVPANVANVVDRLLALRPEERFASASDVVAALRGESSDTTLTWLQTARPPTEAIPENVLVKLFDGPDRLLHLREDAARILWQRTEGRLEEVEAELERWIRLGLASRKGPLFAVDRASLDWLAVGPSGTADDRHLRALFAHGRITDATREAIAVAGRCATTGKLGAAMRVLADALRLVRECGAATEGTAILTVLTKVALAEGTPRAFDQALYELDRAKVSHSDVLPLQVLMRASLAAPGARGLQAREEVEKLKPLRDPELERARHRIRITAVAVRPSTKLIGDVLEEIAAWWQRSGHTLAKLALLEGQARRLYHEGSFEEAASLYSQAAALEPWVTGRIDTMLRSASASMEAFRHEDAVKTAEMARRLAMESRHPYWEGRAEWVLRSVHYRTGKTAGPDLELVGAVERVGADDLEALVCVNEAAAAMRADEHDTAIELAERAATIWRRMERPLASMIARSLSIACGAQTDTTEVQTLAKQAESCTVPGIGIQALGLLGRVFPSMRSSWRDAIPGLVRDVPRIHWHQRMDILSIDEALCGAT